MNASPILVLTACFSNVGASVGLATISPSLGTILLAVANLGAAGAMAFAYVWDKVVDAPKQRKEMREFYDKANERYDVMLTKQRDMVHELAGSIQQLSLAVLQGRHSGGST